MSTVKLEIFIQASPEEVYRYFTSSTALRDWMCDVATADPRPGGRLYMCWPGDYYTSGEYLKLEKDKFVSFTWFGQGEPRQTQVEVSLRKQKVGTLVKLSHRGIGKGQKWEGVRKTYEMEWQSAFENLASVLENGPDLRITRRPMLGIYLGEFNADFAAKLGVPVAYGIRLEGVIDGMGAQKAGLKKDDVIVAMDDKDLSAGTTLASVIGSKHAGDVVEVSFYRGAAKRAVKMTLSGRHIPSIPTSIIEFSRQIEQIYQQYETEIEALIKTASEEECAYKPGPSEWSAREVLAHLVQSERGWQNNAAEIIDGHEGFYDEYTDNIQARIDGTVSIFPTKVELMRELKAHDAETVSLLAHIPADFLSHKGKFWKLVFQADQNPLHLQAHIDQIRNAIQSAKKK
jgi:uncharacterized protein YndB with AHSA1/START domain